MRLRQSEVHVDGGVHVLPCLFEALVLHLDVLEGSLIVRNVGVHAGSLQHSARLGVQVLYPQEFSCNVKTRGQEEERTFKHTHDRVRFNHSPVYSLGAV